MIIKQYTVLESLYVGAEKATFCRILYRNSLEKCFDFRLSCLKLTTGGSYSFSFKL